MTKEYTKQECSQASYLTSLLPVAFLLGLFFDPAGHYMSPPPQYVGRLTADYRVSYSRRWQELLITTPDRTSTSTYLFYSFSTVV
jgi:hypothetical protein